MRVLHIGKFYPPYFGGIEKVNYDLVEGLNAENIETDVLVYNHQKNIIEDNKCPKIFRAKTLFSFASQPLSFDFFIIFSKIYKQYDVLHFHLPNPIASLSILIFNPKAKIVLHWHNDIIKQKFLLIIYKSIQKRILKRANAIIVTSPNYVEGSPFLKNFKNKCFVVPIGISKDDLLINVVNYNNLCKKYYGKKIVFSVGRLSKYKGFEYLIKSAIYLNKDTIVLIAGEGEEEANLKNLIRTYKLTNKVYLLGKIGYNELSSFYKLCDVFCMSSISRNEGFGIVQLEAMIFEKPIITTNIPGSGIVFGNLNDVTGKVVPIRDEKAIAKAINFLTENKSVSETYGLNGKARVESIFSKDNMILKTIDLYTNL